METFFIVKNEKLIELHKEYESMKKRVNDAFVEFSKKHGIEAKVPILLNELERARLEQSADTLKEIINGLNLENDEGNMSSQNSYNLENIAEINSECGIVICTSDNSDKSIAFKNSAKLFILCSKTCCSSSFNGVVSIFKL